MGHALARGSQRFTLLVHETIRAGALRRLRLLCAEAVRGLALAAPVTGAFERWHFGWLMAARDCVGADPLLPLGVDASAADEVLASELKTAGGEKLADGVVAGVVARLRAAADAEAKRLPAALAQASKEAVEGEGGVVVTAAGKGGATGLWHVRWGSSEPLKISADHLAKLRAMHARTAGLDADDTPSHDSSAFKTDLVRVLLRYKAIGGSGFQAAIGGGAHAVLRHYMGCTLEVFASPLNARTAPFGSAFIDTDGPFGSVGSFFALAPGLEGSFEANPPFAPRMIEAMVEHMNTLLTHARTHKRPLLFAVIVGASAALQRDPAWAAMQRMASGRFGRAQWRVPLHQHGYTEGHAHIMPGGARATSRMSSCETAIFIWASDVAASGVVLGEAEVALRAALRATVPRKLKQRATKANRAAHAEKKKKKRGR